MKKGIGMGKEILRKISKRAALTLITALTALSLSGCGYTSVEDYLELLGILDPEDYSESSIYATEELSLEPAFVINGDTAIALSSEDIEVVQEEIDYPVAEVSIEVVTTSGATQEDLEARKALGITDASIEECRRKQEGLFAFERLTDSGKTLYAEMLLVLENQGRDVVVSTTSDEAVETVFDYIMIDHPEVFYVDGYKYTNYTLGGTITKISFSGNYLYGLDEVKSRQTRINEYVNRCLAGAPSSEDDYYAIRYVYEYIVKNTEYDITAPDNQNICSVCLYGRSVCNGYAKTAQYILNKLGIECTIVEGTVDTSRGRGERHAWNLVRCNNAYYHLDVTWGDASFRTASGESADMSKIPAVDYSYLNVTSAEIGRNHKVSDLIPIPECNSMADNYYVREGEYFTSAELTLVGDLFDRRYNEGADSVTIKCATQEVYDQLFEELVTGKKVFDYFKSEDNSRISYTTFKENRTIIFWL